MGATERVLSVLSGTMIDSSTGFTRGGGGGGLKLRVSVRSVLSVPPL